ncbi:MAG: ORF6N domain-containing protein [Armatimonadetes bacterium]|nr:ORF6N domain-containing protein [Armatimonadota bacterium]
MEYSLVPLDTIVQQILVLRGQRVILDADLARMYGVSTRQLNQQIKRNPHRFPDDFMFQLTENEKRELITNCDRFNRLKHSTSCPMAFTEHGALMAASVLNSPRAVEVSVYVVRAFVKMREMLATHAELSHKLAELESRVGSHDEDIAAIMEAIRQLLSPPDPAQRRIGFRAKEKRRPYTVTRTGQRRQK